MPASPNEASIERWTGSDWKVAGKAALQVGEKELHLAVERSLLGLTADKPLRLDFKWTDNVPTAGDGVDFLDHGDTAPNARFNYRYEAAQSTGTD